MEIIFHVFALADKSSLTIKKPWGFQSPNWSPSFKNPNPSLKTQCDWCPQSYRTEWWPHWVFSPEFFLLFLNFPEHGRSGGSSGKVDKLSSFLLFTSLFPSNIWSIWDTEMGVGNPQVALQTNSIMDFGTCSLHLPVFWIQQKDFIVLTLGHFGI